jgi:pimeloyl-ACP methyl ester carboxylesterase
MTVHGAARERFLRFRRTQPRPPRLGRGTVRARGLNFAVYVSPAVPGTVPLLCVNGGLHFGHDVLWPALSPLSRARQLILFDQRGRGESQAPPGPNAARIEHDAGDIPAIREALAIDAWNILGHSWGGGIAMLATAMDQDAVQRLVLVDSVGPDNDWLPELHVRAVNRLSGERQAALAALDPEALHRADFAAHAAYTSALYPAWFADRDFAAIFAPPRADSPTGAAVAARLRREGYDWMEEVRSITAPTLVVHGEDDLLPVDVARRLASEIAGAQLALIPHAGHMPFWEAPEEFFGIVERFLSGP